MLPGYKIDKLVGRGGMGAVYRGVQTTLDRKVAIKILPPGLGEHDPAFVERFLNEARLMAKLAHPNVVTIYDSGETKNGQLYYVMELMDGTDVARMISEQGRLSVEQARAICLRVCDALSAAHDLGIVHRDIKPANVLVSTKGVVKVGDFGLARLEHAAHGGRVHRLLTGRVSHRASVFPEQHAAQPVVSRGVAAIHAEPAHRQALGGLYRVTDSELRTTMHDFVAFGLPNGVLTDRATLHELGLSANYNSPRGYFARMEANLFAQSLRDDPNSGLAPRGGDTFWHFNAFVGYRFHRNLCELSAGVLYLTDQNYQLSPLNPWSDIARERTFVLRFRLSF